MSCPYLLWTFFLNNVQPWSMQYAISSDGLHWTNLNGGRNIVNGTPDGLRDVYVNRGPDGFYYAVATRNYGDNTADPSILFWKSEDLINWPAESVAHVMGPGMIPEGSIVSDLWAPEWHWDTERNEYMVFWAAKGTGILPSLPSANCSGTQDSRFAFFKSYTSDWSVFSSPEVFFDPGCYNTGDGGIDGDIIADPSGNGFIFVYKDARGVGEGHAAEANRGIRLVRSPSLGSPYDNSTMSPTWLVPTLVEAPQLVQSPDNGPGGWLLYYDCSFWPTPPGWPRPPFGVAHIPTLDGAGVTGNFTPYPSACTGQGKDLAMPAGATHGSYVCIDDAQLAALLNAFPST